ncbi:MAG: cytochrome c oxidase subunit 3 [Planctomycetota bacterium]|nr:cytochrome c oxidase subunit 3 [Planctomycetota bacterium]
MLRNEADTLKSRPQLYREKLGVNILIVSLAIFFVASLVAYVIIRTSVSISMEPLVMPVSFLVSTVVLIANSLVLHFSVLNVHREKQIQYRRLLALSFLLVFAFLTLQIEGMFRLISTHLSSEQGTGKLYGISFTLAFLHALHVIGGIVFLIYIWIQTGRDRYDHERHWTVDICATYWHFLDVIWIVMLITFCATEATCRS